jgi:hypothetical protein
VYRFPPGGDVVDVDVDVLVLVLVLVLVDVEVLVLVDVDVDVDVEVDVLVLVVAVVTLVLVVELELVLVLVLVDEDVDVLVLVLVVLVLVVLVVLVVVVPCNPLICTLMTPNVIDPENRLRTRRVLYSSPSLNVVVLVVSSYMPVPNAGMDIDILPAAPFTRSVSVAAVMETLVTTLIIISVAVKFGVNPRIFDCA